jgi:signal transduction histidine kinase
MSTATSSEFMALCRSQLRLLAEGLGASLSVVYMTEELEGGGESKLLPVVVYPETGTVWSEMMTQIVDRSSSLTLNRSPTQLAIDESPPSTALAVPKSAERSPDEDRNKRCQILLPLVYDGTILGLLATTRESQPWNAAEQTEIQHIAQTIALAGILDRRRNWFATELHQQQALQIRQQDILHNLLHQLRNPLTAIRTFGKLLIKRLQPEDRQLSIVNSIVRESDRLQELLQHLENAIDIPIITEPKVNADRLNLLATDRRDSPSPSANLLLPDASFQIEFCQLTDVLDPLILSAEAIAQDRGLNFYSHVPHDLPLVRAHPAALREVLSNLIDNALKYTPAGGEVDIDVEVGDAIASTLQICIRDTGLGIPPQDLDKLFTRHYRGVQAEGSIAGTGLGLSIAKELVAHMQGKIEVTSPPPGSDRGTEFILCLQLAKTS